MPAHCQEVLFDLDNRGAHVYSLVLDSLPEGVVLLDADTTVLVWSAGATGLTGISPASVIGMPLCRAPLPQGLSRIFSTLVTRALMHRTASETLEISARARRVEVFARAVTDKGTSRIILVLREAEAYAGARPAEQAVPAQRAERGAIFARSTVHDLNNVLTAIMTHATLLKNQLRGCPDAAASAAAIERSAQRGAELIAHAAQDAGRVIGGGAFVGGTVAESAG
jgi:signal transduction histidine kinase